MVSFSFEDSKKKKNDESMMSMTSVLNAVAWDNSCFSKKKIAKIPVGFSNGTEHSMRLNHRKNDSTKKKKK